MHSEGSTSTLQWVSKFFFLSLMQQQCRKIMDFFIQIEMWNGVTLHVDWNPAVTKTMDLDTKVMADFLSTVGRCCRLTTMWGVLCNEQDLLEGV
mmetsp:Transcript_12553/g.18592  ORF Transcript_12553/g.18592 Transcript_12553/m.18592 type:complete len:94 (+) Transcript_12553:25-306(+)